MESSSFESFVFAHYLIGSPLVSGENMLRLACLSSEIKSECVKTEHALLYVSPLLTVPLFLFWGQDSLILEKNDLHHPVCSFQDDFQEFEMIDDEDEDDEEEEDDDPDAPPSPFASPPLSPTLGTLKSRPTTLNLTAAVSQVTKQNSCS